MRQFSLDEAATLFWRDMEKLEYRADYRHFDHVRDAIIWAFEELPEEHRWSAYLRLDSDHAEARIPELRGTYESIRASGRSSMRS